MGGTKRYVKKGIEYVRAGGKVGVMSVFPAQQVELDRGYIRKEADLIACFSYASWGNVTEFPLAIEGLASGRLVGGTYITHRFPLDEIGQAFRVAEHVDGQDAIKVSIVYLRTLTPTSDPHLNPSPCAQGEGLIVAWSMSCQVNLPL